MAKKTKKKAGGSKNSKPAKARKAAGRGKPRAKAKPAKKTGKSAGKAGAGGAPLPPGARLVSTGKGATPAELGAKLVSLFNQGSADAWVATVWDKGIVSCEGVGANMEWVGRKAVEAKNAEWSRANTVLGASAEGPFVGSTGFAVKFRVHVRDNATGAEQHMSEVGVYTVRDGKIVREEFMYAVG